jgi:hypothetical protein
MYPYQPPLPPTPTLHQHRRRHHRPPHRQIHPRRLRDTQPRRRPLRPRTAPSPTLREARLARRRPQRPLRAYPLAADLLPERPLRPSCRASFGDRGLDSRHPRGAHLAGRRRAREADAAVRRRRAWRHSAAGQVGLAEYGLLRAHARCGVFLGVFWVGFYVFLEPAGCVHACPKWQTSALSPF